jgi:hypothetical protein
MPATAPDPSEQLIGLYERAERRLRLLILDAANRGGGTAAYRAGQLRLATAILHRLGRDTPPLVEAAAARSWARGVAVAQLRDDVASFAFGSIHRRQVSIIARALTDTLDETVGTVGRAQRDLWRGTVLDRIGEGLIVGDTRRQVSARTVMDLQAQGLTGFVDKAGRRWRLRNYASMAVLTTGREAATAATVERLTEAGQFLVTVSQHPGGDEDRVCAEHQGRTFALRPGEAYPLLRARPPFHPRCRHVLLPARVSLARARRAVTDARSLEELERALGLTQDRRAA